MSLKGLVVIFQFCLLFSFLNLSLMYINRELRLVGHFLILPVHCVIQLHVTSISNPTHVFFSAWQPGGTRSATVPSLTVLVIPGMKEPPHRMSGQILESATPCPILASHSMPINSLTLSIPRCLTCIPGYGKYKWRSWWNLLSLASALVPCCRSSFMVMDIGCWSEIP